MDEDRNRGMGIVVEYAGQRASRSGHPPGKSDWNYLLFGESKSTIAPDEVIPMEIGKINGGKERIQCVDDQRSHDRAADQDSSGSPLSTRFRQQERRPASASSASA